MKPDKTGEGREPSENLEPKAIGDTPRPPEGNVSSSSGTGSRRNATQEPRSKRASELGREAAERIAHAKDTAESLIADYPWWALGMGLAIGIFVGALINRE
jgi:ElaB/YqjD/DUF883 family membrane-anchored ribosome-binding protein